MGALNQQYEQKKRKDEEEKGYRTPRTYLPLNTVLDDAKVVCKLDASIEGTKIERRPSGIWVRVGPGFKPEHIPAIKKAIRDLRQASSSARGFIIRGDGYGKPEQRKRGKRGG